MKNIIRVLILAISVAATGLCSQGCKRITRIERGYIVAVWQHEPYDYSVTEQCGDRLVPVTFPGNRLGKWQIIMDVPKGEKMWYLAKFESVYGNSGYTYVELHIHSIDDINGSGWDHGKFGRGNTSRVQ